MLFMIIPANEFWVESVFGESKVDSDVISNASYPMEYRIHTPVSRYLKIFFLSVNRSLFILTYLSILSRLQVRNSL